MVVRTEVDGAAGNKLGLPLNACRQTKAVTHDVPGCLCDCMEVHMLCVWKTPANSIDVVQQQLQRPQVVGENES